MDDAWGPLLSPSPVRGQDIAEVSSLLCKTVDDRERFGAGYSSLNDAHILQILQSPRKSSRVKIVRLTLPQQIVEAERVVEEVV